MSGRTLCHFSCLTNMAAVEGAMFLLVHTQIFGLFQVHEQNTAFSRTQTPAVKILSVQYRRMPGGTRHTLFSSSEQHFARMHATSSCCTTTLVTWRFSASSFHKGVSMFVCFFLQVSPFLYARPAVAFVNNAASQTQRCWTWSPATAPPCATPRLVTPLGAPTSSTQSSPSLFKDVQMRLISGSKLPVGVDVSVCGCLSLDISPGMNCWPI